LCMTTQIRELRRERGGLKPNTTVLLRGLQQDEVEKGEA